jgi:hypothetical protein
MATALRHLKIRRVALVDKGANQEAFVTLYKRADPQEDVNMDDKDLEKVSESLFQRLVKLFKSKPAEDGAEGDAPAADAVAKQHADELAERERKLAERETEIAKRDAEIAKLKDAEEAKEYIAKAAKLPGFGKAENFGPILQKIAKALTAEEFAAFSQQLAGAQGQIQASKLFAELGVGGEPEQADPLAKLDTMAKHMVAKSEGKLTFAQAYTAAVQTPEGQTLYAAHQSGRKDK